VFSGDGDFRLSGTGANGRRRDLGNGAAPD
jgi:hypothetical protein